MFSNIQKKDSTIIKIGFAIAFVICRAIKSEKDISADLLYAEYQFALNYINSKK